MNTCKRRHHLSFTTAVSSAALIVALGCTGAHAVEANGYNADVAAPVVASVWRSASTVDVTNGPATLRVSTRITDATAVAAPFFYIENQATGQSIYGMNPKLTSGTTQNGTWGIDFTIPQGSAPGQWEIRIGGLADTIGNSKYLSEPLSTFKVI